MSPKIMNALTIDLEDWFHIVGIEGLAPGEGFGGFESRVVQNTRRILTILREKRCRATFFVLGHIASEQPALVEEVANEGHEIGTHGFSHTPIYDQTREEFSKELEDSISLLERISKQKVIGHRAASFSITDRTLWAIEILRKSGIRYDSSVFPIRHKRYGMPQSSRFLHTLYDDEKEHSITEFPLSTVSLLGRNFPISGGAYFRFLPYGTVKWGIRRVNKEGKPAVFYIHPWEIDPDQPRIDMPFRRKFVHYYGLGRTEKKLRKLLDDFDFGPMKEVLAHEQRGQVES